MTEAWPTVIELAESVRSGQTKAVELLDRALAAIDAGNEPLNAFVARRRRPRPPERCRRSTPGGRRGGSGPAGRRAVRGQGPRGLRGHADVHGLAAVQGRPPVEQDSIHVGRLRAAGRCPSARPRRPSSAPSNFTKTNAWGVTRNPWDPTARRVGRAAVRRPRWRPASCRSRPRSDGGGSTRIPASFTGLVGPQGELRSHPGPGPRARRRRVGALATTVADAARHPRRRGRARRSRPTSLPPTGVRYEDGDRVARHRQACGPAGPSTWASPGRSRGGRDSRVGVEACWPPPPASADDEPCSSPIRCARGCRAERSTCGSKSNRHVAGCRRRCDAVLAKRSRKPAHDLAEVTRKRAPDPTRGRLPRRLRRHRRVAHADDGSAGIQGRGSAARRDRRRRARATAMSTPFTMLGNSAGTRRCSVPAGVTWAGLPVGLQITTRRHRDEVALRLARILEQFSALATRGRSNLDAIAGLYRGYCVENSGTGGGQSRRWSRRYRSSSWTSSPASSSVTSANSPSFVVLVGRNFDVCFGLEPGARRPLCRHRTATSSLDLTFVGRGCDLQVGRGSRGRRRQRRGALDEGKCGLRRRCSRDIGRHRGPQGSGWDPGLLEGVVQDADDPRRSLVRRAPQPKCVDDCCVVGRADHRGRTGVRHLREECAERDHLSTSSAEAISTTCRQNVGHRSAARCRRGG